MSRPLWPGDVALEKRRPWRRAEGGGRAPPSRVPLGVWVAPRQTRGPGLSRGPPHGPADPSWAHAGRREQLPAPSAPRSGESPTPPGPRGAAAAPAPAASLLLRGRGGGETVDALNLRGWGHRRGPREGRGRLEGWRPPLLLTPFISSV